MSFSPCMLQVGRALPFMAFMGRFRTKGIPSFHRRPVYKREAISLLNYIYIWQSGWKNCHLEQFSFECRKVIGFAFTTLRDWLKRFAPLFYPIRRKTKTNCVTLACIFPRFASATCNYFEF